MNEIRYQRSTGSDPVFAENCRILNQELDLRMGVELQKDKYAKYNQIDHIRHVILAYDGDTCIGSGAIRALDEEKIELKRVYVRADLRNRGIGRKIVMELMQWAKELGYHQMILESGMPLVEAHHIYYGLGFVKTENWGPYIGLEETSLCMAYDLDQL